MTERPYDGGPAFPIRDLSQNTATGETTVHQHVDCGMSLRDYFAAKAMQSILGVLAQGIRPTDCIRAAEDAYFVADAMLEARK